MSTSMTSTGNLVTVSEKEAAELLGFSVKTFQNRRWLRQEPAFLKIGRKVRYRVSDLEAFLETCTVAPCSDRA